jgi:transposase-like protein
LSAEYEWMTLADLYFTSQISKQYHRASPQAHQEADQKMKGFKTFISVYATLDGVEVAHMIRKKRFGISVKTAFQQFAALAG